MSRNMELFMDCHFFAEGCQVAPGKDLAAPRLEPKTTNSDHLFQPSSFAGGIVGINEKCPLGSWVVGVRVKTETAGKDKMGIVGTCL